MASSHKQADPGVTTDAATSYRMSRQSTRDTLPEALIRRRLHAQGRRYRIHVRPLPELRRTADIVFTGRRVAVFVDGCFWHSCPEHGTRPRANAQWWESKLNRNIERDAETNQLLDAAGWVVVRVWEHQHPDDAVDVINRALVAVGGEWPSPARRERRRSSAGPYS
jgi:DNA mismatch endonuclease (patch repair protein)